MIYVFRGSPAVRPARPKRDRKEPARYQVWQKLYYGHLIRVFGLYYFEDKGEVKRCLEKLLKWMLI